MQAIAIPGSPLDQEWDGIVFGIGSEGKDSPEFQRLDQATQGTLSKLIDADELSTKAMKVTSILYPIGLRARQLLVVGLGPVEGRDAGIAFRVAATAAKAMASSKHRNQIAYGGFFGDELFRMSAVIGSLTGGVGQDIFRAERSLYPPEKIYWLDSEPQLVQAASVIAESINLARRLINLPPNYLYPESFAAEAIQVAEQAGISIEVWDQARLEQEKCGGLLAVARGSVKPPRLCILRYPGSRPNEAPIALIGKGVTFDSGGLSLKPTDGMLNMKCDMAGAATVLGVMRAAALLKIDQPLIGLVGLVENLISGDSFKLGDVVTARSGKTIEIHNTDAEGRLVLADVLNVALDHKPSRMVDFATLTGACVVALGNDVVGAMTNDDGWQKYLLDVARRTGEYVWPLPMFSFYSEQIAGKVADIKNVGEGRWGGAITAAKFLEEFVGKTPWVHLDIAGPAFCESAKSWTDAGATGIMIRTMIELLRHIPSGSAS